MKLSDCKFPCKLIFLGECGSVKQNELQKYGLAKNITFELKYVLKKTYIVRVINSFYAINDEMANCIEVKMYE